VTVRQYGKANARALLYNAGIKRGDKLYAALLRRLTLFFERTNKRNAGLRAIGAEIERIADRPAEPAGVARLRYLAGWLKETDSPPDWHAVMLIAFGAREQAKGKKRSRAGGNRSAVSRRKKRNGDLDTAARALNTLVDRNPFKRYTTADVAMESGTQPSRVRHFTMAAIAARAMQLRKPLLKL
jgi:hypothetical protein